jgi:hypothetical protein
MNMTPGSTTPGPHGPQVIPGVYTLKLTVDGQTYTSKVRVVNDPRVGETPELMAALRTQNKLTFLSVEGMKESFASHAEVDTVRNQLALLLKAQLPDDVASQAKALDASLLKIGGVVPPPGGGGNRRPADPNAPKSFVEVNDAYNTMVSMIQVGLDMAPTPTQIATWEKDCTDYHHTLEAWRSAQSQIKGLNDLLAKNNLQELTLSQSVPKNESCSFKSEGDKVR